MQATGGKQSKKCSCIDPIQISVKVPDNCGELPTTEVTGTGFDRYRHYKLQNYSK